MQTITLYRYTRSDGGITTSPIKPDTPFDLRYRLIADEGKALTDGTTVTTCTDTDKPDAWTEIDAPGEEPNAPDDPNAATEKDYQAALEQMGVSLE